MSAARKLGPFDIEQQLGVGGMGVVYLATYRDTGQRVALKVLSPALSADKKLISRFEREIEILKKLEHPNIVRYFGGGRVGDQPYYAMEYMDGGSLDTVLARKGQLSWEQTVRIGLQLCSALEHAHASGIIHRDLKPGNLFITRKGRLKLGDFGIARDTDATALTAAGKTVGTYAYMAPEQIHGKQPIGPRTDIYAMGCLLYQFLTGSVPFTGTSAAEMFMKHLNDEPDSVCQHNLECPVWLDRVIRKMLAKDSADRPYDALAVQALLEDVRHRVATQTSVASEAMTRGAENTVVSEQQRQDLKKAIGRKKKKRRRKSQAPFYERAWFLSLCLLMLVAVVTWAAWPPSEPELFERIQVAMRDEAAWPDLVEEQIPEYLSRFPDGPNRTDVLDARDFIQMSRAKNQALSRRKRGLEPRSPAEAMWMDAWELEQSGDRLTAYERYEAIVTLFDTPEERDFANLARRQMRAIEEHKPEPSERVQVVNRALRKADGLPADSVEARRIWQSIVRVYADKADVQRQVEYARARLEGKNVPPLDGNPEDPARRSPAEDG